MPACLSKHLVPSYPISPTQIGYDNQDQVHMPMRKQQQLGIVSILDTSSFTTSLPYPPQQFGNNTGSLRRTLSADMSSKKWLSNNGFSASPSPSPMMKRIGSSHDFHSFKGEKDMGRGGALDDIWSSIPKNREGATADHNQKSPTHFDIWSSIITSNKEDDVNGIVSAPLPPAYVHPSVKRASSLSNKSLDICTESLGSETGSDGFSSQPPSEPEPEGDSDSDEQQSRCSEDQEIVNKDELLPAFGGEEIQVPKYNYYSNTASCKRVAPKSFPPPMPSLAHRDGTSLLHMRSLRENGRLVLEAVSVPSQNCLRARRQDGRLLLTLAPASASSSEDKEIIDGLEFEENERTECEAEEREEEEEESKYERDKHDRVGIRVINGLAITTEDQLGGKLPTGGLMIKTPRNGSYYSGCPPDHHKRLNKVVADDNVMNPEEENTSEGLASTLPPSLPPRPRAVGRRIIANAASATAGSLNLNTYEYYWRKNINKTPPIAAAATWPTTTPDDACIPPRKAGVKEEVERRKNQFINVAVLNEKPASPTTVVVDGKQQNERREYLVPLLMQQGCKEARRSLLFWEPYCIATT